MDALSLDAATVARNAGIDLRAKGSRLWACCPIHGEKTPSLCFFPDGRFHCFGCGADGDAADLYAALYGVTLAEALRVCRGKEYEARPRRSTAADLRRKLNEWKGDWWSKACKELHAATATMIKLEQLNTPEQLWKLEQYWEAADRLATAKDTINLLESADMAQLLKMCAEDQ